MSALGPLQKVVLRVLSRQVSWLPIQLAQQVREHIHAHVDSYWWPSNEGVAACLRRLADRGLVERLDRSDGKSCWTITDAGLQALEATP